MALAPRPYRLAKLREMQEKNPKQYKRWEFWNVNVPIYIVLFTIATVIIGGLMLLMSSLIWVLT